MNTSSPVTGFSHVQLSVSDVVSSEGWYTLVLGLERLAAAEDGTYVALRHRPSRMVVVLSQATGTGSEDPAAVGPASAGPAPDRLDHIAFAVADGEALVAWADQLIDLGVDHKGVVDEDGRPSLMLVDPDGNQVELVAPPAR
jgi:catechol-2,3-dioxygenase